MDKQKYLAFFSLLTYLIIGATVAPILVRIGLISLHPFVLLLGRQLVSLAIVLPILFRYRQLLNKRSLPVLLIMSGFFAGNMLFFTLGIVRTTLFSSQLLYATLPVWVSIISYFFLKEKISHQKLIGILLSATGLSLLLYSSVNGDQINSAGTMTGNLLLMGAVLTYALYLIFSKKFSRRYPSQFLSGATYAFTPLLFAPLGLYGFSTQPSITQATLPSIFALVGIGVISFILIATFQFAVKRLSSITVALGSLLSPELAAIAGAIVYHEQITSTIVISTVLVVSGLMISIFEKKIPWWQKVVAFSRQ